MRTVLGFVCLGLTAVYFALMMAYGSTIWNLPETWQRLGIVLGWCALGAASVLLLKKRSDRLKDRGFIMRNGRPQVWEKWPVDVYYERDLPADWVLAVNQVVVDLNNVLGYRFFRPPTVAIPEVMAAGAVPGVVKVRDDDGIDPKHASTIFWPEEPPTRSALVTLPRGDFSSGDRYAVALHELGGHVLGLDHDATRDSVMWPELQERPVRLTDRDKSRLREAYPKK